MRNNFIEPEIIYEDDYLLVYNKPAGLSVQTAKVSERDLESIARAHVYDAVSIGDTEPVDVHVVHRLDQPVSGLVVIAKGGKSAAALSKAFGGKADGPENGGASKVYKALVCGALPNEAGELVDYLAKDGKTNTSRVVTEDHPGDIKASGAKKAILKYQQSLKNVSIKVKPEVVERYKKAAELSGMSMREFILTAIEEKIERMN